MPQKASLHNHHKYANCKQGHCAANMHCRFAKGIIRKKTYLLKYRLKTDLIQWLGGKIVHRNPKLSKARPGNARLQSDG